MRTPYGREAATASRGAERPAARALLGCLCLLAGGIPAWAAPEPTCQARRTAERVLVSIELRPLLSEEALRLVRLGLKGQIRIEGAVLRRRLGLFEQTLATVSSRAELSAGPDGRTLLLDGRALPSAASIRLERVAVRLDGRTSVDEPLTFRGSVEVRVVTASSLARVAAWATETSEEEASSSLLTRALLEALANDLTRTGDCSCAVRAP